MNIIQKKREEFSINIRKQKREQLFKIKRISKNQQLPFSNTITQLSEIYYNIFYKKQCPNNHQHNENMKKILKISELADQFNEYDCEQNYDSFQDVQIIFDIINNGYPIIDRACLQILHAFSLPNHQTCKPMLKYIPNLMKFFYDTPYQELKQNVMIIFQNLAADCSQCRDVILIYEIPQSIFKVIDKTTNQLMDDLAQILINISRTQPIMSHFNQILMIKLCEQLFPFLSTNDSITGILQLILKICIKDNTLMDLNFLNNLCQNYNNSDLFLNEILSLIKIMSFFDRNRYESIENEVINFLTLSVNQTLFSEIQQKYSQKNINKVLVIFTNMIIENPQIIFIILKTKIIELFKFDEILQDKNREIYGSIYFYSFYYQIICGLNQPQLKSFILLFQPIKHLINQLDENQDNLEIIISILEIIEIILQKNIDQIQILKQLNGEKYLADLSKHEDDDIYQICENIFNLIK